MDHQMVVVALWDMVEKAANLVQLLGLDAVTLFTIATSFLRFQQARKECRKLEGRVRMLRALLLSSAGGRWITQQQQRNDELELASWQQQLQQVDNVLREASDLVENYRQSTLYARIVRGGSRGMATRFRDLRSRVDSCCHLIIAVNAFLLVAPQPPNQLACLVCGWPQPGSHSIPRPALARLSRSRTEGNDDYVGVPPSAGDSAHAAEAAPDDTHVSDITPIQLSRND